MSGRGWEESQIWTNRFEQLTIRGAALQLEVEKLQRSTLLASVACKQVWGWAGRTLDQFIQHLLNIDSKHCYMRHFLWPDQFWYDSWLALTTNNFSPGWNYFIENHSQHTFINKHGSLYVRSCVKRQMLARNGLCQKVYFLSSGVSISRIRLVQDFPPATRITKYSWIEMEKHS